MSANDNGTTYQTSDLELASFLLAKGAHLLDTSRQDNKSRFTLQVSPDEAMAYFRGEDSVSARALFSAWRSLRTIIEMQRGSR